VLDAERSVAPQDGVLVELPALPPAIDAATTAAHLRALLDGQLPVPAPITRQVQCLKDVLGSVGTSLNAAPCG
jgi:hypothetical protein